MTISRGQMNRQLYMGGGIMNAMPREQFGLGSSIKKAVKKVTGAVKDVAKSDVGKAALLAAGAYYAPGFGIKAQGGFAPFLQGAKTGITNFFGGTPLYDEFQKQAVTRGPGIFSNLLSSVTGGGMKGNVGKLATLAGLSGFLTSQYGMTEEQVDEVTSDPEELKTYLRRYYTNLNPNASSEEIEEFVRVNSAEGGRMYKAKGDTASQNAMQAAGIEGLPIRQNPKGVKELDLRDNGGFIPPVGIKEKEDDIPAMLSNNEFVFTADAVRGMGDGDVDLGAQRMYDMMKQLEAGGRV